MARIDLAEEKLIRKIRASKDEWVDGLSDPGAFDRYVKGIADFADISESEVRSSEAATEWDNFRKKASDYVDYWEKRTEAGVKEKWKKNYKRAFSG